MWFERCCFCVNYASQELLYVGWFIYLIRLLSYELDVFLPEARMIIFCALASVEGMQAIKVTLSRIDLLCLQKTRRYMKMFILLQILAVKMTDQSSDLWQCQYSKRKRSCGEASPQLPNLWYVTFNSGIVLVRALCSSLGTEFDKSFNSSSGSSIHGRRSHAFRSSLFHI